MSEFVFRAASISGSITADGHTTIAECVEAVKGAGDCCDECMDAARDAAVLVLRGLETTP